jgi:broad specificity phosphatase PhoE
MVQFVLIRPGSTDYDEQGRIQGTLDIPLSEQGTREVQRIVEELKPLGIAAVYCGPCQAACQTATAIAEALGVKLKQFDTLANIDHGLWQGMLIDDVKRKHPKVYKQWQDQPEIICPPEGEMLGDAVQRVQAALAKILKKHKQGTVAIVAPEPLGGVIHAQLCNCEVGEFWKSSSTGASWELILLESPNPVPTQS